MVLFYCISIGGSTMKCIINGKVVLLDRVLENSVVILRDYMARSCHFSLWLPSRTTRHCSGIVDGSSQKTWHIAFSLRVLPNYIAHGKLLTPCHLLVWIIVNHNLKSSRCELRVRNSRYRSLISGFKTAHGVYSR